ncbi:hypothetical protein [Mycobacterium sp. SMC-17]|uniref:hypothetical protein n=1 Tax=Mycobacterium sp. SMC-17 TaxID=3381628 RepID=UPI003875F37F
MGKQFGWGRFLVVALPVSILTFILDVVFHKTAGPALFGNSYPAADYPQRPLAEIMDLFPFLGFTYVLQLTMLCFLFLRLYPGRGLGKAAWWGIWGGLFVVIPNMQFFVAVAHTTWTMLIIQMIEAIALCVLAACLFEIAYHPKDYNQDNAATTSASVPVSSVG